MKSQAVVVLAALFLLTALITNIDCFSGPIPGRKRELEGKVLYRLLTFYPSSCSRGTY
jgi:hypothetical protein